MQSYLTAEGYPALAKIWDNEEDAVFDSYNGGNYCLCCGQPASHYGSASMSSSGISQSCSKEVCVICLESGCRGKDGKGCFGHKLALSASEYHFNCGHA